MPINIGDGLSFCGHALTQDELTLIRQITREFANLALTELAATVCELLSWQRPNGRLKTRECYLFLQELHQRGWLPWLPTPQPRLRRITLVRPGLSEPAVSPVQLLVGSLQQFRPIRLELIDTPAGHKLFREYLTQHHYLGYHAPFGAQLRYFVRAAQPELPPLSALLFTSAAWRMAPRDRYIGWTDVERKSNLRRVVNNSRFLILPWTRIPHLASHVLSLAARQLPRDWLARYGVVPLLLETLVDPSYRGICYRAANWIPVGITQGRGRMDREHRASLSQKQILVYPLHRHWRHWLCRAEETLCRAEEVSSSEGGACEPAGNFRSSATEVACRVPARTHL